MIIFQTNSMVQRVGSAWGQERVDGQIHEEQILHDSPLRPGLAHLHSKGANQEEIGKSLILKIQALKRQFFINDMTSAVLMSARFALKFMDSVKHKKFLISLVFSALNTRRTSKISLPTRFLRVNNSNHRMCHLRICSDLIKQDLRQILICHLLLLQVETNLN